MADVRKAKWEVWIHKQDVLGIRTIESKPRHYAFNHGREWCEHVVELHNQTLGQTMKPVPDEEQLRVAAWILMATVEHSQNPAGRKATFEEVFWMASQLQNIKFGYVAIDRPVPQTSKHWWTRAKQWAAAKIKGVK